MSTALAYVAAGLVAWTVGRHYVSPFPLAINQYYRGDKVTDVKITNCGLFHIVRYTRTHPAERAGFSQRFSELTLLRPDVWVDTDPCSD